MNPLVNPTMEKGLTQKLVGLNIFANRMFQQFPTELGVTTIDPGTPIEIHP